MSNPQFIIVGTDLSEQATRATDYAMTLAKQFGAKVRLVLAVPVPGALDLPTFNVGDVVKRLEHDARSQLDEVLARHRSTTLSLDGVVALGDPRDVLVAQAEEAKADLIVVGTHGRRGLRRALLGSVAEAVVRTAPCPVLVVR